MRGTKVCILIDCALCIFCPKVSGKRKAAFSGQPCKTSRNFKCVVRQIGTASPMTCKPSYTMGSCPGKIDGANEGGRLVWFVLKGDGRRTCNLCGSQVRTAASRNLSWSLTCWILSSISRRGRMSRQRKSDSLPSKCRCMELWLTSSCYYIQEGSARMHFKARLQ